MLVGDVLGHGVALRHGRLQSSLACLSDQGPGGRRLVLMIRIVVDDFGAIIAGLRIRSGVDFGKSSSVDGAARCTGRVAVPAQLRHKVTQYGPLLSSRCDSVLPEERFTETPLDAVEHRGAVGCELELQHRDQRTKPHVYRNAGRKPG